MSGQKEEFRNLILRMMEVGPADRQSGEIQMIIDQEWQRLQETVNTLNKIAAWPSVFANNKKRPKVIVTDNRPKNDRNRAKKHAN